MSLIRPWAFWRRVQYGSGFFVLFLLVSTALYSAFVYVPPTCFDGLGNGSERGVDCGGSCVRICTASVQQPSVVWAQSFKIIDGQYNAVAYIKNTNVVAATPELRYTFTLKDNGVVIAERSGKTILPPNSVYPIFEGRIKTTDGKEPTETTITLEPVDLWQPAAVGADQFTVRDFSLTDADTRPRLKAVVENTELTTAENVEVVATIFSSAGVPLTASQTFIDSISPRSSKDTVFTWPNSIAKIVRSCEIPSDIMLVLDRSGSMAGDGGTPPEPLESAKKAAEKFATQVNNNNLLGFLSYATTPSSPLEQTLTSDKNQVKNSISRLLMGEDGIQYTNMGDAFTAALAELTSDRHRPAARKVIIFLTDGDVTRPVNPETGEMDREYAANYARAAADQAKAADVTIYTIGFGDFVSDVTAVRDVDLIRNLASSPELYFAAPTVTELGQVYEQITNGLCEEGAARIEIIPKTDTNFIPLY